MKMHVSLYMVMTLNGAIAKKYSEDVISWTSEEDRKFLIESLEKKDVVLTGSKSFFGKLVNKPYYVITHSESFDDSSVNIVSGEPDYILKELEMKGFQNVALLGGLQIIDQFLKRGLIDELFITIEPQIMGDAIPFSLRTNLHEYFELLSYKILNHFGTIMLHYKRRGKDDNIVVQDAPLISSQELMDINKKFWNERASLHMESSFYEVDEIINSHKSLLAFELEELGDLHGKRVAHLQCHIGTETILLAKLGAIVDGLDYSEESVKIARELAGKAGVDVTYVCSDVYEADKILKKENYDIIFVNFGALTMLPDLSKWGKIINTLLKEGGEVYISELHPVAASLSYSQPLFTADYFNNNPQMWDETGSYADGIDERYTKKTINNGLVVWNWTLGDIITVIAQSGFYIEFLHERNCHVDKRYMYLEKHNDNLWYAPDEIPSVPGTFTLKAKKIREKG